LLDRPLVEMLLFMPLAWIGGLGLAAVLQSLDRLHPARRAAAPILLIGLVVIHALMRYDFRPSECCTIAGYDDAAALDWLEEHLPAGATTAIAAAELTLEGPGPGRASTGIDAGIWITPLTGRPAHLLNHDFDFAAQNAALQLCARGFTHIYIGGEGRSFDAAQIEGRPEWYAPVFLLPGAQIYEIRGCPAEN
jgi:hypothetical protein